MKHAIMKNRTAMIALAALFAAMMLSALAGAQNFATVQGKVLDDDSKPLPGAVVELVGKETGRKYSLPTNKKGEFSSIGVTPGIYDVTLMKDGTKLWQSMNYQVSTAKPDGINAIDFDLHKLRAELRAAGKATMSAAEVKAHEQVQQENMKIKTLNDYLARAKAASDATPPDFDTAIKILTEATNTDGTKDLLWFKLGDAYLGAKKWADAITNYDKAIALKPTGPYYNNLGQAYGKSGHTAEAIKAYNDAAAIDPTMAGQYYFNLGAVLTNAVKTEEANVAFDKAIAADPAKAEAYYWKGINLLSKATTKGDKMVAFPGTAEAFNKYLELKPDGQLAQQAKDLLATLGAPVQTSYGKMKTKKK